MFILALFKAAFRGSFRDRPCNENPDERRGRLHEEALREIDAEPAFIKQTRIAMRLWEHNNGHETFNWRIGGR